MIEQLLINNYRVIKFDNRDSGKSSWINRNNDNVSPYTLDDMADDTIELINYLNISAPLVIATAPVLETLTNPNFCKSFDILSISRLKAVI